MTALTTFANDATAVVIGASGGIGGALAELLAADPSFSTVFGFARSATLADQPGVTSGQLDITNEQSIEVAAQRCTKAGPLDLVIVATGILHTAALQPEKRMRDLDGAAMQEVYAVNAIGPALVAKHFLPHMRQGSKTVFAAISARVGSISDNRLGGWASYRASKAALNMLLKTLAIEHARSRPDSSIVALHPGTVDTALSQPFQARVPENKLFTPEFSAAQLLSVIDTVGSADSGGFFAWDGQSITY